MFKFYLLNVGHLKKYGFVLPFLVYSRLKIYISKSSSISLAGRIGFGSKTLPETSPKYSTLIASDGSKLEIGKGFVVGGGTLLFVKENAVFSVGDNTYITSDTHIECVNNIRIGSDCAISWGVTIIDDDHHEIIYEERSNSKTNDESKVTIGDHVWIGCNVTILKNTHIGSNSVVAAGSVVRGSFPANVMIGGNPAKVLRENVSWK